MEVGQERHDPTILFQELVIGSRDQRGIERDACFGIVEDDHAFHPGLAVVWSVDLVRERLRHRSVIVQLTASHARANHAHARIAEAGKVTHAVEPSDGALWVDDDGADILRAGQREKARDCPGVTEAVFGDAIYLSTSVD